MRKFALYVAEGIRFHSTEPSDYVDGPAWIYDDGWYVIERNGTYAVSLLGSLSLTSYGDGRTWPSGHAWPRPRVETLWPH